MKKLTISIVAIVLLLGTFTAGVYASSWKTFDGKANATQTENNIDTLVNLIDDLNGELSDSQGDYTNIVKHYENVIKELQGQFTEQLRIVTESKDAQIQDLQTVIQDLKNNQSDNKDYIKHLEKEVDKANELMQKLEEYSNDAVESVSGE